MYPSIWPKINVYISSFRTIFLIDNGWNLHFPYIYNKYYFREITSSFVPTLQNKKIGKNKDDIYDDSIRIIDIYGPTRLQSPKYASV